MKQNLLKSFRFCANHINPSVDTSKLSKTNLLIWPPPDDFVIFYNQEGTGPAIGRNGDSQGCFGDTNWNSSSYGYVGFNFAKQNLSKQNTQILKELMFICLWYMPLFPGKVRSLTTHFGAFVDMGRYSDKHGVRIDELYKFPKLYEGLLASLTPSKQKRLISVLALVKRHQDEIGITLANHKFMIELKRLQLPHIPTQHAYIPPRIWAGLIQRCDEIIDLYLNCKDDIENAICKLIDTYKHNKEVKSLYPSPFDKRLSKQVKGFIKLDPESFIETYNLQVVLDALGISIVLPGGRNNALRAIAMIIDDVEQVCFWYVVAHSIQRKSEASDLRFDCFHEDSDPRLGKVAMLCGETIKTDPDSDARWIVPRNVKKAIDCLKSISTLKHHGAGKAPTKTSYLFTTYRPEWNAFGASRINKGGGPHKNYNLWRANTSLEKKPIFSEALFRITPEDYAIAYQLTPRLTEKDWFKEGGLWHFTPHQFRRTLAVNLFATGISDDVVQWMMKHKSLAMTYYYGRNYSRLKVNAEAGGVVASESYNMKLNSFIQLSDPNNKSNVFAVGHNRIDCNVLHLIKEKRHKDLMLLVKKGLLDARPTLLGLCMSPSCSYGGIESVAHCAGTFGKGPCKDAVFSKSNGPRLQKLLDAHKDRLLCLDKQDVEHVAITHEIKAIEVYFNATSSNS